MTDVLLHGADEAGNLPFSLAAGDNRLLVVFHTREVNDTAALTAVDIDGVAGHIFAQNTTGTMNVYGYYWLESELTAAFVQGVAINKTGADDTASGILCAVLLQNAPQQAPVDVFAISQNSTGSLSYPLDEIDQGLGVLFAASSKTTGAWTFNGGYAQLGANHNDGTNTQAVLATKTPTSTVIETVTAVQNSLTGDKLGLVAVMFGPSPAAPRSVTSIDSDNDVQAGQTGVIINGAALGTVSSVTLGGESLVVNSNTATTINVDVPLSIDLLWGTTSNQLSVTDEVGTLTLDNVTLTLPTGWETVLFDGSIPAELNTESFYEEAKTDLSFTMVSGDILAFESSAGLSVDTGTYPTITPPNTVTGDYKIWSTNLSSWTTTSTYTWTDGGTIKVPFNTTLLRNLNRGGKLMSKYPLGDAPSLVQTGDPILLFSDLISVPRQGWSAAETSKGAALTLYGFNFGAFVQGETYVTIGGVNVTAAVDLPVWGVAPTNPHLNKITVYLNYSVPLGNQSITITTGGKTCAVPLTVKVTNNNIYFADPNATTGAGTIIDPWLDPVNFTSTANAGDVLYCRAGTFTQQIDGGNALWYIRPDGAGTPANDGTVSDPIAICGYPSETCTLSAPDAIGGSIYRGISIKSEYYTISGLTVRSTGLGIDVGGSSFSDGHRAIGNDVSGCQSLDYAGHIITQGSNCMVLGNKCHGGRSGNKLDHAIYPAGDASRGGCHIAWNYIIDNDFDTGPLISINHQDERIASNENCKSHYVYGNFLDSTAYACSGITVYDLSWDDGTDSAGEPEPAHVFNNVLVGCGTDRTFSAMSAWGAHSKWFNNTLIDTIGTCFSIENGRVLSCEFKNNILHCADGHTYEYIRQLNLAGGVSVDIDHNNYYNSTGGLTDPTIADSNAILTDPSVVVDLVNATLTQAAWTKTAGVSVNISTDYNAIDRDSTYSVGAIA